MTFTRIAAGQALQNGISFRSPTSYRTLPPRPGDARIQGCSADSSSGRPLTLLPRLQALVLADHIYQDAATGKKVVAGTFNRLWAETFPTQFGRPTFAYVSLTEIRGKVTVSLRYVDNQDLSVLMETKLAIEGDDPLETLEVGIPVPGFPMPHPGSYSFELHANGEKLGSMRVNVIQMQQQEPPK